MKLILVILMVLICCTGCAWFMSGSGQMTVEDAVKLTKAQGGSGCIYLKVTGAYPGFATGVVTIVEAHDSTGKLTFKDCLDAIPQGQRLMKLE